MRETSNRRSRLLGLFPDQKNRIGRMQSYGCYRCGDRWNWKQEHTTYFTDSEGCFPLCEECWAELSPEDRLPFYARLVGKWLSPETNDYPGADKHIIQSADKWPLIKAAVLSGK